MSWKEVRKPRARSPGYHSLLSFNLASSLNYSLSPYFRVSIFQLAEGNHVSPCESGERLLVNCLEFSRRGYTDVSWGCSPGGIRAARTRTSRSPEGSPPVRSPLSQSPQWCQVISTNKKKFTNSVPVSSSLTSTERSVANREIHRVRSPWTNKD